MILIGMFGSLMVILLFRRKPLSDSPCSIYFVMNGILSFFFLPIYYFPVILVFGFQMNRIIASGSICKFQMSYAAFTVTSVFLVNCLISLDRYAISSRSARIRSFSSKRLCQYLVAIVLVLSWLLIGLPTAILSDNVPIGLSGPTRCATRSYVFLLAAGFFYFPILEGVLPIVLAIYFWFITRRQVRTLNNQDFSRRFDKQMTRMYFIQIVLHAISSVPFAAINLYISLTSQTIRSETTGELIQSILILAIFLFYIQYSSDFYVFLLTSAEFQVQTKNLLCLHRQNRTNRVVPIQTHTHSVKRIEKITTVRHSLNTH